MFPPKVPSNSSLQNLCPWTLCEPCMHGHPRPCAVPSEPGECEGEECGEPENCEDPGERSGACGVAQKQRPDHGPALLPNWEERLQASLAHRHHLYGDIMWVVRRGCEEIMERHRARQTESFYEKMLACYLYERGIPYMTQVIPVL